MQPDFISQNETTTMALRMRHLCAYLKANGSFSGVELAQDVDVFALTDEQFMERQRIHGVFVSLDKDGNGTLEYSEFKRLLRLIGAIVSPMEEKVRTGGGTLDFHSADLRPNEGSRLLYHYV